MPCDSSTAQFLAAMKATFPFAIADQEMLIGARGFGACCDPAFADIPSALLAERFTSVRLKLVRAAQTDYFLLDQTSMPQFFAAGQGESAEALTNIWEVQTYAENNCYPSGAPVDLNQSFLCFGHSFEFVGLGARLSGQAPLAADPWEQLADTDKPASNLEGRVLKAIAGRVYAFANFGNTTINYLLGTLIDAPAMAGLYGANVIGAGQPIVGAYKPYKAAFLINARDQSRKLTVSLNSLTGGRGNSTNVAVQADDSLPIGVDTLYAEFKMRMFGVPLCWSPDSALCNTPTGTSATDVRAEVMRALQSPEFLATIRR